MDVVVTGSVANYYTLSDVVGWVVLFSALSLWLGYHIGARAVQRRWNREAIERQGQVLHDAVEGLDAVVERNTTVTPPPAKPARKRTSRKKKS